MATLSKSMLAFGESKKVTTLPSSSGITPDIEVITDAAKKLYAVGETKGKLPVKQYDDNFEEWIDIDDALWPRTSRTSR